MVHGRLIGTEQKKKKKIRFFNKTLQILFLFLSVEAAGSEHPR